MAAEVCNGGTGKPLPQDLAALSDMINAQFAIQKQDVMAMLATQSESIISAVSKELRSAGASLSLPPLAIAPIGAASGEAQSLLTGQMPVLPDDPAGLQSFSADGFASSCVSTKDLEVAECSQEVKARQVSQNSESHLQRSPTEGHEDRAEQTARLSMSIADISTLRTKTKVLNDDTSCRSRIEQCLRSSTGEYTIALLIVGNAMMFGIQADYVISHNPDDLPVYFKYIEWFFCFAFTFELSLRLFCYRLDFFSCKNLDVGWNFLDTFLVVFAYVEEILDSFVADAPNISSARLLRLLRLLRMIRVLRVLRFFKDMRIMVTGILGSLKPLVWALLLLGLIIYMFSIIVLQLIQEEIHNLNASDVPHFSSLLRLMFTLFACISGGVDWADVADSVQGINPILGPLFIVFIAFSVFCVLNIVTGVFVDQSTRMAKDDEENMLLEEIESRKKWMKDIEVLFRQADTDHSGTLEFDEFQKLLSDMRVETLLKNIGVDLSKMSLRNVWEMLDFDNSGSIEMDSFAVGLQNLHGDAKSIDVSRLRHEVMKTQKKLARIVQLQEVAQEVLVRTFQQVQSGGPMVDSNIADSMATPGKSTAQEPLQLPAPPATCNATLGTPASMREGIQGSYESRAISMRFPL